MREFGRHGIGAEGQAPRPLTARVGAQIIHQTDQEHTDWTRDDYTHQAYRAAWGEPPARYWITHEEMTRRLGVLRAKYEAAGFRRMGLAHSITFEPVPATPWCQERHYISDV